MEKPLEKKAGRNYGPPGSKRLIYCIDDMNMPEVDAYGTVQPHTLIRQHMDYGHWYECYLQCILHVWTPICDQTWLRLIRTSELYDSSVVLIISLSRVWNINDVGIVLTRKSMKGTQNISRVRACLHNVYYLRIQQRTIHLSRWSKNDWMSYMAS